MKPLKISLQNPCSENWNEMTPVAGGRRCERCEKCVVDFTQFNDRELASYFSSSKEKPCGRYRPDQLNKFIYPGDSNNWRNRAAGIAFGFAVALGFNPASSQAQTPATPPVENVIQVEKSADALAVSPVTVPDTVHIIRGTMLDYEKRKPVEGAIIKVEGMNVEFRTGEDGKFRIELPIELWDQEIYFNVETEKFPASSFVVDPGQLPSDKEYYLFPKNYKTYLGW